MRRYIFFLLLFFVDAGAFAQPKPDKEDLLAGVLKRMSHWTVTDLSPQGRIDAVRFLNDSVIVCGTRGTDRGKLFISEDKGVNWKLLHHIAGKQITCIAETPDRNIFYLLTGDAEVLVTKNGGRQWKKLVTLTTNKSRDGAAAAYGMVYTPEGTLLVTDTDSDGGHIYRSANGGKTWKDLGVVGQNGLYRFEKTGDAIIANGFDGKIYRSTDDGISWKMTTALSETALFATEYMGEARLIQADKSGNIFRSDDGGSNWHPVTTLPGSADDFIHIHQGVLYYSTYTGDRNIYFSADYGKNWLRLGAVPTNAAEDWLDHGVARDIGDSVVVVAGTGKGALIRNAFSKRWLEAMAEAIDSRSDVMQTNPVDTVKATVKSFRHPRVNKGNGKNLIPNASFEAGKDGWSTQGTPTGWGGDFWDLYGELDSRNAFDGYYSLRIELGKEKTPVTSFDSWPAEKKLQLAPLVANKGWIDVIPGMQYTFSVYMRASRDNVPGLLKVFQGPDLRSAIVPVQDSQIVKMGTEWKRYSITVTALDQQIFIAAGPALTDNETLTTVWVDALQLERSDKATAFVRYDPFEIGFSSGRFGNIFQMQDTVAILLSGSNSAKKAAQISLQCRVTDYFDSIVWRSQKAVTLPAGSHLQSTWPIQLPGRGYYKIRFSWHWQGVEQVRSFPLTVIENYKEKDSPFGINHAPTTPAACLALQQAGIRWARNWSINWDHLEPVENTLSFDASDEQIEREQSMGFKTLALLPPLPSTNWNSLAPDSIPARLWLRAAYAPKDERALMNFIGKALRHYQQKTAVWEFLNEPIWTKFCLPGDHYGLPGANYLPQDYTRLLKQAYTSIKKADPSAVVIGGFSAEPWRYTKDFILSGGLEYVDILNIHNYGGFTAPEKFIPEMDTLLSYMDQYGKRKPIWITEYAYYAADDLPWIPWNPPANYSAANLLLKNEKQCADWTVRYNVIKFARGVDKIFYHQGSEGLVNHSVISLECPLLGDYAEPRKVFAAQSALANILGSAFSFAGSLINNTGTQSSHSIQAYGFQCGERSVLVAWLSEEEKRKVRLNIPGNAEVFSVMGNRINVKDNIGLDISPVYIVSSSKDAGAFLRTCSLTIE